MRPWLVLGGLSLASPALAHHDTAVQQVGATTDDSTLTPGLDVDGPRIEVRVAVSWQAFGRLQHEGSRYGDAEPSVTVERYTLQTAVRLASRTRLALALPMGRVRVATPGRFGWGDLSAALSQDLGPLRIGTLAVAPTGRTTLDPVSSVLDVVTDDSGTLTPTTYDTRASLGAGTWRTGLTARWRGEVGWFASTVQAAVVQPLGATADGIRWGQDATARAGFAVRSFAGRLSLGAGLAGWLHTADRLAGEPGDDGAPTTLRTGRRRSLGVLATIGTRLSPGVTCGAQARAPVARWVQGIQLAESLSVAGQCTVGRGLRRAPANPRPGP